MAGVNPEICNATVVHRRDLNEALGIFRVLPDGGSAPPFRPGQFATLGLPRDDASSDPAAAPPDPAAGPRRPRLIRRAYSIASGANERGYLEFFIVLIEHGALTPRIWALPEGGRIWVDPRIRGEFTLPEELAGQDAVFVATGTGVAPFLSMLRTFRGAWPWRRCVLLQGVRLAVDLGYQAELESLAEAEECFRYVPVCSREPEGAWAGLRGRVNALLEGPTFERLAGFALDPARCHVFLCGNPDMITSVRAALEQRGFRVPKRDAPGNLHFERYW